MSQQPQPDTTSPTMEILNKPPEHDSYKKFRREAWWQVTFPVAAVAILGLAGIVMVALGGAGTASVIADYSLILVTLLWLVGGLFVLAIFGGLFYLMVKATQAVPPYTGAAQHIARQVYKQVDMVTDKVANVVISFKSWVVGIVTVLAGLGIFPDLLKIFEDDTQTE